MISLRSPVYPLATELNNGWKKERKERKAKKERKNERMKQREREK